jgi:hypothetical protein
MSKKFYYILVLLILIIFVSQSISIILSIPFFREGFECLPKCEDVSLNPLTGAIPNCKGPDIKFLNITDANSLCVPKINKFISNITTYLNNEYQFNTFVKPLYDINKKLQSFPSIKLITSLNSANNNITKYFTDFSGISSFTTNQDILDNMANDDNFNNNIDIFGNFFNTGNNNKKMKNMIGNIKNIIERYKKDRTTPSDEFKNIYKNFLNDISSVISQIENRCDQSNPNYLDDNLKKAI